SRPWAGDILSAGSMKRLSVAVRQCNRLATQTVSARHRDQVRFARFSGEHPGSFYTHLGCLWSLLTQPSRRSLFARSPRFSGRGRAARARPDPRVREADPVAALALGPGEAPVGGADQLLRRLDVHGRMAPHAHARGEEDIGPRAGPERRDVPADALGHGERAGEVGLRKDAG